MDSEGEQEDDSVEVETMVAGVTVEVEEDSVLEEEEAKGDSQANLNLLFLVDNGFGRRRRIVPYTGGIIFFGYELYYL